MTLHAGHCVSCDAPIFRTAAHALTGKVELLYPIPSSVYARVAVSAGNVTPGIGYCAAHVPILGDEGVVALETAGLRYTAWYTPKFGAHLRAWLEDHLELPEHERDALMAQWAEDCRATEGVHA